MDPTCAHMLEEGGIIVTERRSKVIYDPSYYGDSSSSEVTYGIHDQEHRRPHPPHVSIPEPVITHTVTWSPPRRNPRLRREPYDNSTTYEHGIYTDPSHNRVSNTVSRRDELSVRNLGVDSVIEGHGVAFHTRDEHTHGRKRERQKKKKRGDEKEERRPDFDHTEHNIHGRPQGKPSFVVPKQTRTHEVSQHDPRQVPPSPGLSTLGEEADRVWSSAMERYKRLDSFIDGGKQRRMRYQRPVDASNRSPHHSPPRRRYAKPVGTLVDTLYPALTRQRYKSERADENERAIRGEEERERDERRARRRERRKHAAVSHSQSDDKGHVRALLSVRYPYDAPYHSTAYDAFAVTRGGIAVPLREGNMGPVYKTRHDIWYNDVYQELYDDPEARYGGPHHRGGLAEAAAADRDAHWNMMTLHDPIPSALAAYTTSKVLPNDHIYGLSVHSLPLSTIPRVRIDAVLRQRGFVPHLACNRIVAYGAKGKEDLSPGQGGHGVEEQHEVVYVHPDGGLVRFVRVPAVTSLDAQEGHIYSPPRTRERVKKETRREAGDVAILSGACAVNDIQMTPVRQRYAAIRIQRLYRRSIVERRERAKMEAKRVASARAIQKEYRAHRVRKAILGRIQRRKEQEQRIHKAAVCIQALVRGYRCRRRFGQYRRRNLVCARAARAAHRARLMRRALHAWKKAKTRRTILQSRIRRTVTLWGWNEAHLHFGVKFDAHTIQTHEGRDHMAHAYHQWRARARMFFLWQVYAAFGGIPVEWNSYNYDTTSTPF